MWNGENGHRHLGSLHFLYQQEPTELDRRFIEIRQWLAAEGDYSDLIIEQGLLQDDDLQTKSIVVPFHLSVEQALESVNGRNGN